MKLAIIGTGYIGLVGAAVFADWGNEVIGIDIDLKKIERIKSGDMPIYEPGLSELVLNNISAKRLDFTTSLPKGIKDAEVVFICVGTPQGDDGSANLNYVWSVAKEIGENLDEYKVIVVKSTVPVGTNERVKEIIKENLKNNVRFDVVSNPEFLREGSSIEDMQNTDRTVVGYDSERALKVMRKLYSSIESPLVECDLRSAELIKYASNAFLATKISFINEIAQLCEKAGANVQTVAKGMGLDKRIGNHFLNAGLGYGGSCFPKDVAALYKTSTDMAYDFKLLRSVMEVNHRQRINYVKKIEYSFGKNLSGKTVACLGLAFKNNTDDIRESVAIKTIRIIRGLGAKIKVYDPQAVENAKNDLGLSNVEYTKNAYDCVKNADALCILTEWEEFKLLDYKKVKSLMKGSKIFDGRNLLKQDEVEKLGFEYFAIGKISNGLDILDEERPVYAILRNGRRQKNK
ncbi:UDP-glucose 6-dehydrogenase [candidate division WWE3 bacterium RBG_19FT_COMBO_34_6]|uniref:UDP-glucose 6-dehydrogenase n=1 Tax=candidate division WWE3 bacterium RBG_19FT_COMBO_34_6 TaxID=1802612 RepID=A0A1F4UJZ2_UNCKA|nr:MAG: UDP-glucose 6-dehydrogenase [candidate division WWE3 bacterium RBG_19FT_COMBO_34_6]